MVINIFKLYKRGEKMKGTYNEEIALTRKKEHEKAWNRVKDNIFEGQVVSRCYKKH